MKAWKYTPTYPQSLRTALVLGSNSVTTTLHIRHKQPFRRRKPGTETTPSPPPVPLPSVSTRLAAREPWVLGRRRHQHPRQEGPEARPRPNARYQDAAAAIAAAAAPSSYNNAGDSLIIRSGHYMEWRVGRDNGSLYCVNSINRITSSRNAEGTGPAVRSLWEEDPSHAGKLSQNLSGFSGTKPDKKTRTKAASLV